MSKIWDAMKQAEQERELPLLIEEGADRPLTTRQQTAIAALLETSSLAEACRESGVSERTMRRWLKQPYFVAAYHRASRMGYANAIAHLRSATGAAVGVLREALRSDIAAVRVQAAMALLDLANKAEVADAMGGARRRRGSL